MIDKNYREVFARMGIGHARESSRIIHRFIENDPEPSSHLIDALDALWQAEVHVRRWAEREGIEIKDSMPT